MVFAFAFFYFMPKHQDNHDETNASKEDLVQHDPSEQPALATYLETGLFSKALTISNTRYMEQYYTLWCIQSDVYISIGDKRHFLHKNLTGFHSKRWHERLMTCDEYKEIKKTSGSLVSLTS